MSFLPPWPREEATDSLICLLGKKWGPGHQVPNSPMSSRLHREQALLAKKSHDLKRTVIMDRKRK